MCGINAIYRYTRISDEDCGRIRAMNREMLYRGPDEEGAFSDETAALGMRRLSIIGVENGSQPLFSEDRRLALVCNGEIYNFKALRAELESKGHRFCTDSDCEVIVHLYQEKGVDCLNRLRGMFAFVLWDSAEKRMLAARDPVGEKPLYFAQIPSGVVFSSELKAIARHALPAKDLDFNILRQLTEFTYPVDMRQTFVRQIQRLLPGEYALVDPSGVRLRKYWKVNFAPTYPGTRKDAGEDVLNLLRESIDLRLQSEVPVAVMLSGGIDSSAVAVLAAASGREIHAVTVGYRGQHGCDERESARRLANEHNLRWHEIELDEADFEAYFEEYTTVIDEPVADPVCIPQWGIYKKARELGFKVLLSGTGGDELFFGYPYHNITARQLQTRIELNRRLPIKEKTAEDFGRFFSSEFNRFSRMNRFLFQNPLDSLKPFEGCWKSFGLDWPDAIEHRYPNPLEAYLHEAENGFDQLSAVLFSTWLPGNCMLICDKLGMGSGLEVRAPFLDPRLVELVFSLPVEWRFAEDSPKSFLKRILRGIVPDAVLDSPKKGFTIPDGFLRRIVERHTPGSLDIVHRHFHTVVIDRVVSGHFGEAGIPKTAPCRREPAGPDAIGARNLALIRKTDPWLYGALTGSLASGECRSIPTPSGPPTLAFRGPNGRVGLLHDPKDPVGEADALVEGMEFKGEDITVVMGFGLGYIPLAIRKRMHPDHRLFILEANPQILLEACRQTDLSPLLTGGRTNIFVGDSIDRLLAAIEKEILKVLAGSVRKLIHAPSLELSPEWYKKAEGRIESVVDAQRASYRALTAHSGLAIQNVLGNLEPILAAAPIDALFSRSPGIPALVVAAGPSLDKNIGLVKEFQNRFQVIAVDAALLPLVRSGILPDLVVSVDPIPINDRKFESIPPDLFRKIPLAFSPMIHFVIPTRFPGAKFVFGEPNRLCQSALALAGRVSDLPYGFTVSHFAFYIAREMGCDPILFAGLDLSFPDGRDHASHCATTWKLGLSTENLITVPGIDGKPVSTHPNFARMIALFEREIRRTQARCIDATEGGAYIPGTEVMPLREAAGLCPKVFVRTPFRDLWAAHRFSEKIRNTSALTELLDSAVELEELSRSALSRVKPMLLDLQAGGAGDPEAESLIDRISDQVNRHRLFLEWTKDQMADVLVDQYRISYELERVRENGRKRRLQVQRSQFFFERLARVSERFIRFGRPVLNRLESPASKNRWHMKDNRRSFSP